MRKSRRSEIKRYKATIATLKKENKRLKAELYGHGLSSPSILKGNDEHARRFSAECRSAALAHEDSYFGYLKKRFLTASFYSLWKRFLAYFRRIRLVSTIFKIASAALAIVGTGAFFIVVSAGILILIPFIILFFAFFLLSGIVNRKRKFEALMKDAAGCSLFVFFPTSGPPFEKGSCLEWTVDIIANDPRIKSFTIIVSPYFFSAKGFGGRRSPYYHILRTEADRVCIIRRNAFFAFRKNFLSDPSVSVTYVY